MKTHTINLKTLLILFLTLFMAMAAASNYAHAITWNTANQATVAWDPVTTLANGDPLPADNTVDYVVYLVNSVTDPNKANPVQVWQGAELTTVLTLNVEGAYLVGVKAIRKLPDATEVGESIIHWSDNPDATGAANEFGIRFYFGPAAPTGLRQP